MNSALDSDVKALAPYGKEEFPPALRRVLDSPVLPAIVSLYFRDTGIDDFRKQAGQLQTTAEFQRTVIYSAIQAMLAQSSRGLSLSGFSQISPERRNVFISNHRLIVLDPALFCVSLHMQGFDTPQICLGDN